MPHEMEGLKADMNHHTVDGSGIRRSPVEVGSLSHYLQGFIRSRWRRISSINSMNRRCLAGACWGEEYCCRGTFVFCFLEKTLCSAIITLCFYSVV